MKGTKGKIIIALFTVLLLAGVFWWGGDAPGLQGWQGKTAATDPAVPTAADGAEDGVEADAEAAADQGTLTEPAAKTPPAAPGQETMAKADQSGKKMTAAAAATAKAKSKDKAAAAAKDKSKDKAAAAAKATAKDKAAKSAGTKAQPTNAGKKPTAAPPKTAEATPGTESRPGGSAGDLSAKEKVQLAAQLGGSGSGGKGDAEYAVQNGMVFNQATGKDQYQTAPVPKGKPVPVEPQTIKISDTAYTCTLTVRCDTILEHMDWLDSEKAALIPADGIIFPTTTVTFYEGESVFHVLLREMKKAKIHFEFTNAPIYNSAYVEGLHNLYEFDCGELSGWMYRVNDWFPNYGCSRYLLKQGDAIEWVYTCDLGADVDGFVANGG